MQHALAPDAKLEQLKLSVVPAVVMTLENVGVFDA
jgi:hypothetical protein